MMKLLLGDTYKQIFKNFQIEESQIFATYNNPDYTQDLKLGVRLFLKRIGNNSTRSYLLLCSKELESHINNYNVLAFAYWIPRDLIESTEDLLSVLRKFVSIFGCRIRIGRIEDKFISETKIALNSRYRSPEQIIEILQPKHIPCEFYYFDDEFVVSEALCFRQFKSEVQQCLICPHRIPHKAFDNQAIFSVCD
jgi:hypothetical protein